MDIGMLWMDDGGDRDLNSRISEAAASYEEQYGVAPSLCMISEAQMNEGQKEIAGIKLEGNPRLLPNYFWIGRSSEGEQKAKRF